ncbi:MAG: hypothetical protein ACYSWU_12220, partial [Planctomycetota bacterium]
MNEISSGGSPSIHSFKIAHFPRLRLPPWFLVLPELAVPGKLPPHFGAITSFGGIVVRCLVAGGLLLVMFFSGCAPSPSWTGPLGQPVAVFHENPMLLPIADPECAWETV